MKRSGSDLDNPDSKKTILSADGADLWASSDVPVDLVQSAALAVEKQLRVYTIKMFGKKVDQPRRVGFYGPAVGYRYSGTTIFPPTNVPEEMVAFLAWATERFPPPDGYEVGVLVNRYASGKDYISFHSDDEKGLHGNFVATVSTGADRFFVVKKKETKETVAKLSTEAHPMIVMEGAQFQKEYIHGIPKKKTEEPRTSFSIRWHKV